MPHRFQKPPALSMHTVLATSPSNSNADMHALQWHQLVRVAEELVMQNPVRAQDDANAVAALLSLELYAQVAC